MTATMDALTTPTSARARTVGETRLAGRRLVAARTVWAILMVWMVVNFALSLPNQLAIFRHPTARSAELAPRVVVALRQVGITTDAYAWAAVGFGSLIMLVAVGLALVLVWRRGDDWMALLASLLFPAYCLDSIGPSVSFNSAPIGSPLAVGNTIALDIVSFTIIVAIFMLFPSGRFVPAWSRAVLAASLAWVSARAAAPTLGILVLGYPVLMCALLAFQVYRYRRVSSPLQRVQTRWAVFGLVSSLLANQAFWWSTTLVPPLGDSIYPAIAYLVLYASVLLVPVTFFIAIQRHRLYEIDTLINRALVYGLLTACVAAIYLAIVLGTQAVARPLVGQAGQQPVVIVASTLLVAALFTPLRRRIQALIDRTFYRAKYDAARTLADFGVTLRMETDLEALQEHLLGVVQQTVQPTHLSVWLRPREARLGGSEPHRAGRASG